MSKGKYIFGKIITLTISAVVLLSLLPVKSARAVTATDWTPGYIINDTLFSDGDGMSIAQIQAFLVKLLPSCDIWGTQTSELGGGTRAQYAASVGNPAPFTCITNYYEVPKTSPGPTIPTNNYGQYNPDGSTYIPAGSKSAAQLIYDAAQQYNINPKALIIKLATESDGPITSDDWPLKKQYYYVMGAHCPDSGPGGAANCDINYSGFSLQIAESAKLLRSYLDGMEQDWWPYKRVGGGVDKKITGTGVCTKRSGIENSNCVGWNVATKGCGGTIINIQTKATAALYTYTPYQPNTAALNNMYGLGDGCSAYGNRNFWRVWNDWFGSTREPGYTPFFQLPGSVATYILGADNTYYAIPEYQLLKDYGFETSFKLRVKQLEPSALIGYTNKGPLPQIARFEGIGVFLVINGQLRPFPSEEIFASYGYSFGQEATLPKQIADVLLQGDPIWSVAGTTGGGATYYIGSGKKQAMCNWDVYTKLGNPVYSSQPIVSLPSRYLSTIPNGAPLAMVGDVIETSDTALKQYGLWNGEELIPLNASIAKESGAINCGAPKSAVDQLTKSSSQIDNTVSSEDGSQYILNKNRRLAVNTTGSSSVDISADKFVLVPQAFLSKFHSAPLGGLVKAEGSGGVFTLRGGKAYGIPSEADLFGLGYTFQQVHTVTQKTLSTIPRNGYIYKPGRIVREVGTRGVYLIDDAFNKHPFTTESAFYNYGKTWSDVYIVAQGTLSAYAESTPATFYIKENDSLYWLMDNGVKRRIPTELIASNYYNINTANSITLPVSVLSQFPMSSQPFTKLFRASNGKGVYLIENGTKRVFASEQAMFSRGYSWASVRVVSPSFVASIPDGQPLF